MAIALQRLVSQLNGLLAVDQFQDYCPNGLQVEGKPEVARILAGVTASQALIDLAVEQQADAILVHHGYFWKGEPQPLTGMKGNRIRKLMQHDISLLAYHLPLDAHPDLGNNRQLADLLGVRVTGNLSAEGWPLVWRGELPQPLTGEALAALLQRQLQRPPLHVPGHQRPITRLAWCTGAAQDALTAAAAAGVDAYISGEVSERTFHEARELGIDYFAAGHHATERYGIRALAGWIARQGWAECTFVDLDNPV